MKIGAYILSKYFVPNQKPNDSTQFQIATNHFIKNCNTILMQVFPTKYLLVKGSFKINSTYTYTLCM